jgi:hypothetical protein
MRASSYFLALVACGEATTPSPLGDGGPNGAADAAAPFGVPTCVTPSNVTNDASFSPGLTVTHRGDYCARTFTLTTTNAIRDARVANPRTFPEGARSLQSGNTAFDALYALALDEAALLSVDSIADGAFNNGQATKCPNDASLAGGCFETGELWKYVWTRDISYSANLGLTSIDPTRVRNALLFKLSTRRDGSDAQIVQDTGTGGSYPVSTDRVVWAIGAESVANHLSGEERASFVRHAFEALTHTLEHDRIVAFDSTLGLYRGETSFLDWREQTYPSWLQNDPARIAESFALSTNLLHREAMRVTSAFATELGETYTESVVDGWRAALDLRIREAFWVESHGLFAMTLPSREDAAPSLRFDLLGNSLAVLSSVATESQATAIIKSYPHLPMGAPVVWPQETGIPSYHNRALWPFVSAYFARAASRTKNATAAHRAVLSIARGAGAALSHMENFEALSGSTWDEASRGPVVNSPRQLWSVAAFVHVVDHVLFGMTVLRDGVSFVPFIADATRARILGNAREATLNNLKWRGHSLTLKLVFPEAATERGHFELAELWHNGRRVAGSRLAESDLGERNLVELRLIHHDSAESITEVAIADTQAVFAPQTPALTVRGGASAGLTWTAIPNATLTLYRDGTRLNASLTASSSSWTDSTPGACYTATFSFANGATSHRSKPACVTTPWRTSVASFSFVGGARSTNHGRAHIEAWGDAGHTMTLDALAAPTSGTYNVHFLYGNGAGPTSTGITCAIKRVRLIDNATNETQAGYVTMPQLGTWDAWSSSTRARFSLAAGHTYKVIVDSDNYAQNMSAFSHFASYTGGTGGSAPFNRVNLSELVLETTR